MPLAHSTARPRAALRLDFLERVSRPLLVRLLTPHDAALLARGFSLAALADAAPNDHAPLWALHELLDGVDVREPTPADPIAPVLALLADIARVSSPAGREALIQLDAARVLPARLGAEDLAATAYLDHPQIYAGVRIQPPSDAIKGFVLYQAPAEDPCFDGANIAATEALLAAWFLVRHRSAFCNIRLFRRGLELHFEITHGNTPKTLDVIEESLERKIVTQVNGQRSYAIYHEGTRLLAVHALEFIKKGIRETFGQGFCGDTAAFSETADLLDMTPFQELDAALAPAPELGVGEVILREAKVMESDRSTSIYKAEKGDVRASKQAARLREAIASEGAMVTYAKLSIELAGRRALLVEIHGSRSQLTYDRRDDEAERTLLDLLASRGIWKARGPRSLEASA